MVTLSNGADVYGCVDEVISVIFVSPHQDKPQSVKCTMDASTYISRSFPDKNVDNVISRPHMSHHTTLNYTQHTYPEQTILIRR